MLTDQQRANFKKGRGLLAAHHPRNAAKIGDMLVTLAADKSSKAGGYQRNLTRLVANLGETLSELESVIENAETYLNDQTD